MTSGPWWRKAAPRTRLEGRRGPRPEGSWPRLAPIGGAAQEDLEIAARQAPLVRTFNFDRIYEEVFKPAVQSADLPEPGKGKPSNRRTDKDFFAGDIGQEMFKYLHWSRIALADIMGLSPNVKYAVGVRHSAREDRDFLFVVPGDAARRDALSGRAEPPALAGVDR